MNAPASSALPEPALPRWQPLRLGLVDIFHYDSEEFWFRDGRLLLRGNNGTGKSKVLSLVLPFLFDANLRPSRIEPDGDSGKKMAWNLLLGRYERRMGYTWIEFGRIDPDGQAHYLTLGCGLSAVAARSKVDGWFFLLERDRIGQNLWLTSPTRVVLTRERLIDALSTRPGQVFDNPQIYRRAVDERLFHLGPTRYGALMDTLIQLRQPQLSRKPDESSLSNALTEALPPLSPDLLADVADAMNQLEEYRRELEEYEALERAVEQFNRRYQLYAATQARRQARHLRSAQTGFDNASRALNEARTALQAAQTAESQARATYDDSERLLTANRLRLEALQNDPAMANARQIEQAERDAKRKSDDASQARIALQTAQDRSQKEQEESRLRFQRNEEASRQLADARLALEQTSRQASLESAYTGNPLASGEVIGLEALALNAAHQDLSRAVTRRQEDVALLRRRRAETDQAHYAHEQARIQHDERRDETEMAFARREQADANAEQSGRDLLDAWQRHIDGLHQLQIQDDASVLEALAAWVHVLNDANPAIAALRAAQQAALAHLSRQCAQLDLQHQTLLQEKSELQAEHERLVQGEDALPEPAAWRSNEGRADRAGAPLWQIVDFRPGLADSERAGIEAALQASGLLDAWVMPDGALLAADGASFPHDTQWLIRAAAHGRTLTDWLQPASHSTPEAPPPVAVDVLQRLLRGVACDAQDSDAAETWVAPDGRFRLGTLTGAWQKTSAEFIGYAARAAARERRRQDIALRLRTLGQEEAALQKSMAQNALDESLAAHEWGSAPTDDALRAAHAQASSAAREYRAAQQRSQQAARRLQEAVLSLDATRQALSRDAQDLALPPDEEALNGIALALQNLGLVIQQLLYATQSLREATAEYTAQEQREREADSAVQQASDQHAERETLAEEARIQVEILQETVGAEVEELKRRLGQARTDVSTSEKNLKELNEALRQAGETRARADQKAVDADAALDDRSATRQQAIVRLQGFASTGLLHAALPDIEAPPLDAAWTIEPALTLARRLEQALSAIKDDDDAWNRAQNQISQEYTELHRSLSALNHQAQAETSDYGLIVDIIYQNQPQRPDLLGARLADEIAQRRELLTANERKILENHLQAEIASAVQTLLRDAERQVDSINKELEKRPTSTGVRFRLDWLPLPEGDEGAPVGLDAARRRLLNTSADLWSAEDRRVVGEMLQQRIASERSRADANEGGSLLEQVSRALDYRRWHRFRVLRWQDGQWKPLSGPASSGERALGLTVPLFAAVSRFYSQSGDSHAPRLVLLDEAFAGIDDEARANCWSLIREFDLDFVITSEREWACSAELPGVAIAQLQRREGVDAIHVSRWTWDGRARRLQANPDRRFPPTPDANASLF